MVTLRAGSLLMTLRLVYLPLYRLASWIALLATPDVDKDIELITLRHENTLRRRANPRPRRSWADRALLAALARLLTKTKRTRLPVTPATLLRWHRNLVKHRWAQPRSAGRPATHESLRTLILRLAQENTNRGYRRAHGRCTASATQSRHPPCGRC
jgi:putative transposase